MRQDGSTDVGAVVRALGRRPGELPALLRTALDARAAFSALRRNRSLLSDLFDFGDAHPDQGRDPRFGPLSVDLDGLAPLGAAMLDLPVEGS